MAHSGSGEAQSLLSSIVQPGQLSPMRIFLSLLVLLIFLLVALFSSPSAAKKRGPKGSRTVLLVGPMGAGKTGLWSKMLYGAAPPTHTSMKENEGIVKARWVSAVSEKEGAGAEPSSSQLLPTPLHLVDTPGHPRLRTRAMAQFLPASDGVVFVVDGKEGTSGKKVAETGEHLHLLLSLLSLLPPRSEPVPLLILLTKSDLASSSSSGTSAPSTPTSGTKPRSSTLTLDRAKQSLLRELEKRRSASSGTTGRRSAAARLEGLEAIPLSSSSSSPFNQVLITLGLRSPAVSATVGETAEGLPSDESEVLERGGEDVWAFEGACEWEKVERATGVRLSWAMGSAKDKATEKVGADGLDGVWEWVEGI